MRYLGFPLWDVLLFPIQALADAGRERRRACAADEPVRGDGAVDAARRTRSRARSSCTSGRSSTGTARENDYLWGRLDGAAHLIGILLGKDHPDYRATCLRAFAAILDEDESALPHVPVRVRAMSHRLSA